MSKIKVSEAFLSIQGEGRYMGVPSVFLRTFGCNFRCPSFGLPPGQKTTEVEEIIKNLDKYSTYDSLPLVSTGCDSYAAVYPEFKNLSPLLSTDEVVDKMLNLLPNRTWGDTHLVITGGEPLLGWQKSYPEMLEHSEMKSLKELTFETNGTQHLTEELSSYLQREWHYNKGVDTITFSISPKLSVSGERWSDAIKPDVVKQLSEHGYAYLKFVISSESDAYEALEAVADYRNVGFDGPVYFMPVGGVENIYKLNNRTVADLALKHSVRYSDRLQVLLWKNAWGT